MMYDKRKNVKLALLVAAISEHDVQWPLGQGVLFFRRAVILQVTFRALGAGAKLR
jgi:hypothetical protein